MTKEQYVNDFVDKSFDKYIIDPSLYAKHEVKRGLRDLDGRGVVTGLTEISDIISNKKDENGELKNCRGELYFRGIDINSIVNGFVNGQRHGFEETAYLLLSGNLPNKAALCNAYTSAVLRKGYHYEIPKRRYDECAHPQRAFSLLLR